jgi:hypothetical protein
MLTSRVREGGVGVVTFILILLCCLMDLRACLTKEPRMNANGREFGAEAADFLASEKRR